MEAKGLGTKGHQHQNARFPYRFIACLQRFARFEDSHCTPDASSGRSLSEEFAA